MSTDNANKSTYCIYLFIYYYY